MRVIIRWSPPLWPCRWSRMPAWLDRLHCALLGHDKEIVVAERVMALRCRKCAWRSPGWQLDHRVRKPLRARNDAYTAARLPVTWPRTTT
jgi:hypothetical protein